MGPRVKPEDDNSALRHRGFRLPRTGFGEQRADDDQIKAVGDDADEEGELPAGTRALAAMKKGQRLVIGFKTARQQDLAIPVTLIGFTAAYNKLAQ